jgi:hypothetical protein
MAAALVLAVVLPLLTAAVLLLGRHAWRRLPRPGENLSVVSRQHIDLFQGGQLNEALVEAAKSRFRALLERGEVRAVEASLRPGPQFVVQVRALTELGTDDAGRILERQLRRRLSDDQLEQAWYWIDLASGLRSLHREESLPHLLRCAEAAGDALLSHFLAAETVCFLGFGGYLRQPDRPLGRAALRVLHRALEGLRHGVPPHLVAEARLGEAVEGLWDNRPERVSPLVVRVFAEARKLVRRAPHARAVLSDDGPEREAFDLQMSRLDALDQVLAEYLDEVRPQLCAAVASAQGQELRDVLHALCDLRAEAAAALLPLLAQPGWPERELAAEALAWSRQAVAGAFLRDWVRRDVPLLRRARARRRAVPPRRSSLPSDIPYRTILTALRGHASAETEALLLVAAADWDPTYRAAALSSLGWWEPFRRAEVLRGLQQGRRDSNPEVRQAARAALARLGERQALQWFRQALFSEEARQAHEAIQLVAAEGLALLWPDLDRLADAEDMDIAVHAREALGRLFDEMEARQAT